MVKDIFTSKADKFVHEVYAITRGFPKDELYGVTSQLRRAALSIILNAIEGFARNSQNEHRHFLDISYGSLKETLYLLDFSYKENYMKKEEYENLTLSCDELGKILWAKRKALITDNREQTARSK